MSTPYSYTQTNGRLDTVFEGTRVQLNPGDKFGLQDACQAVRFVNHVRAVENQGVRDETSEGLDAMQALCTGQGGGPGGASPPVDPPPEPAPVPVPTGTDGGAPTGGQPETRDTLGAPAPTTAGDVDASARAPGESDGRPLSSQYYDAGDPMPDYDVRSLLAGQGVPETELDAAMRDIINNAPTVGAPHPDFGVGDRLRLDTTSDPVLIYTGQFALTSVDLEIASRGFPLRLTRNYKSGPVYFGPWGFNWDHSYNLYLRELTDGGAAIWTGELREDVYSPAPDGGFLPPASGGKKLEWKTAALPDGDHYELSDRDGTRWIFERRPGWPVPDRVPLTRIEDRHGNAHRVTYDVQGRIARVEDHAGRFFSFDYGDCNLLEDLRPRRGFRRGRGRRAHRVPGGHAARRNAPEAERRIHVQRLWSGG